MTSINSPTPLHTDITFQEIANIIHAYLSERDWHVQPSRDLAISISLEANELLEHFQWGEQPTGDKKALASELADILIYAFHFATMQGIDIPVAIQQKLAAAAQKYPAHYFKGKTDAERRQAQLQAKLAHRKEGL